MTTHDTTLLTAIQALSIAGHAQTGIPTCLSVFTTELPGEPLIIHASVTIMPEHGRPWSIRGTTSPHPTDDEETLAGMRDELAGWIADNRKEEAAA